MSEIEFIKSEGASCGIYAIAMAIKAIKGSTTDGELIAKEVKAVATVNKISYFGELYNADKVVNLLEIMGVKCRKVEYNSVEDLSDKLKIAIENNRICLMAYYAIQGYPYVPISKYDMKHGHWMVIYDIINGVVRAKQSNSKADSLGLVDNLDINKLYSSNKALSKVKLEWYKYHKCKNMEITKVNKKLAEYNNQVNKKCKLKECVLNMRMPVKDCCSRQDLSEVFIEVWGK